MKSTKGFYFAKSKPRTSIIDSPAFLLPCVPPTRGSAVVCTQSRLNLRVVW